MHEAAREAAAADEADVRALAATARAALATMRGGPVLLATNLRDGPWDRHLAGDGLVVGTIDGTVVGYAVVGVEARAGLGHTGVLHEVYVQPEARGVGVGEAMLDHVAAMARERGCDALEAVALPGDRATKNFFERFGLTARLIVVHRQL